MQSQPSTTAVHRRFPPRAAPRLCVSLSIFIPVLLVAIVSTTVAVYGLMRTTATSATAQQPVASDYEAAVATLESGDVAAALPALERAAAAGATEAQTRLADLYKTGSGVPRDLRVAVKWYRKAAEAGDPRAQYALAEMYAYGYGVKQDAAKASEWSARALANGYQAERSAEEQPVEEPGSS